MNVNKCEQAVLPEVFLNETAATTLQEAAKELLRKVIHFFIAFTPLIASYSKIGAVVLLTAGVLFYICIESLRLSGVKVPFFSFVTQAAARSRENGRFVMGPVTLGCGALAALMLYPSMAAAIAIYALAFGDGIASLVGKFCGHIRPAFLLGKSIEGSAACFIAVFTAAMCVSHNIYISVFSALAATIAEALPLEDYDNIAIPIAAGLAVQVCQEILKNL
ncbi:MAG: phosphatidate cytidylyltransferase [Spirochaetaceae bacterium]|jgi:dolichol kinase|nr:phosphatidate cytidylyltransferase [Spirochaetaceae bacterium]